MLRVVDPGSDLEGTGQDRLPRVLIETSSILLGWSEIHRPQLGPLLTGQKGVQKTGIRKQPAPADGRGEGAERAAAARRLRRAACTIRSAFTVGGQSAVPAPESAVRSSPAIPAHRRIWAQVRAWRE